ncbi:hypothetical protein MMC14_008176 [Varicellaria rhodocarpa]|nr:hypothetical protein [Varicellaria rhodocarpa]
MRRVLLRALKSGGPRPTLHPPYSLLYRHLLPCRRLATVSKPPTSAFALNGIVNNPIEIRLRDYQEECIQSVLSHLENGHKRLGVSLATGSGKTVIFTQLIDRIPPPNDRVNQTLILVHRRELVEQAARHCINAYPYKTVEIEMGNSHASGTADITIASIQSLTSGVRIEKFNPKHFKLVLVDEAHHIVASGYMEVLRYFGLSTPTDLSPALVGVSATFSRYDGVKIGAAIDYIVYHKDYVDMIGDKWLADVIFTTVESKADISNVKKGVGGDFLPSELSKAVNIEEINEITVRAWLARAESRKSTLVFCVDLAHVTDLTETFRRHGLDARYITSQTPKQLRSERLDDFKDRKFPVLLNCGVFTEGTDIPNIDCILLARPTKSRNLLIQMIGRGMRLFPGKENCHVIDMVASLETGIVTTPTLFGLDPSELIKEATVDGLRDRGRQKVHKAEQKRIGDDICLNKAPQVAQSNRRILFTDYTDINDLILETSGERFIRAISPCCWVQVDKHRWVITMLDGEYVTIEKDRYSDLHYSIRYTARVPGNRPAGQWRPYQRSREVATAKTFTDAVHAADTFVLNTCPRHVIATNQAWREKPATEGQLNFLSKAKLNIESSTRNITKGRAADMITKLKFGARGRVEKARAMERRNEREKEKAVQIAGILRREKVQVGPMEK